MSRRDVSPHSGRATRTGRTNGRRSTANGHRASGQSAGSSYGWVRHGTALPSWADLEPSNTRRRSDKGGSFLEQVSTARFALLVVLVAAAFTLYVGHVHATSDLLNEVQAARTENRQLHLQRNRLQGEFDRRTGPSIIYERAHDLGLRASVSYGPVITVDD